MRTAGRLVLLAGIAWTGGLYFASEPAATPLFSWHDADGALRFTLSADALVPADPTDTPLRAPIWNPRLPDLTIPLVDDGHVDLTGWNGKVLVLDFWASWCTPCRQELPHLEGLYKELKGSGLEAVAVNVLEEPQTARDMARALGLTMPIGRFEEPMRPALYRKALPTVIVADRFGAIRRRFDGFRTGDEFAIARLVRELLVETAPPEQTVATVTAGDGAFRAAWSRDPPTTIDGLAIVGGSGASGVLASLWRGVTLFGADGRTAQEWPSARSRGELRATDRAVALAFRPGSVEATLLSPVDGVVGQLQASAAILDASPLGPDRWVLATARGLEILGSDSARSSTDAGAIAAVAETALDGTPGVLALSDDGRLLALDAALRSTSEPRSADPGSKVVGGGRLDRGYGVASGDVVSSAVGKVFSDGGAGVALAARGRLLVVDLASGRARFQAVWPEIRWVATGDIDGDGVDEIAVATARRIVMLTSTAMASGRGSTRLGADP